ncbi:hypothetical protein E1B28_005370 [Marasmius oreades]|uniref:DUF6533 domain-containing protein n=1 Tax=Marasmius oreades TaxID=181124 RepID=A0A9P7S3A9_9AGAR|nr:uncharacterized protein E1B28_005370 [Marasmius oreades]KAG7094542.1 hypothetical protein E1B28_005370 [Marasmius oreades]
MASKTTAEAATAHYLQFDTQWSSLALLYYDYILTLPMEVEYMWRAKFRPSTVLYIFCRYALLANVLYLLAIAKRLVERFGFVLVEDSNGSSPRIYSCDTWYKIIGALSVLGRAAVIITFSARTYAIFNRNRWILVYFSIIGLICIVLDISSLLTDACTGSEVRRKVEYPDVSISVSHIIPSAPLWPHCYSRSVNTLLSILMVVFEYSSAILTIFRSIQAFRVGGPWRNQKSGFLYLIFEQGVFYFSVVSLFTTGALVLNFRAQAGSFYQRFLDSLILPLSGLLTARFLLHLRRWESKHSHSATTNGASMIGQQSTMGGFRAAPGVLSTIIEDFGEDPVALARAEGSQNFN